MQRTNKMFFLLELWFELFITLIATIVLVIYYFHNAYQYWERKGVPTIKPKFPLGNYNTLLPKGFSIGTLSKKFYDELKKNGHKFGGIYFVTEPHLVIVDPEYIKDIMAKDFQYFVSRGFYCNKRDDPLSGHLFALDGQEWRNLRIKLTPAFTSGKMKMMFHTIIDNSHKIVEAIETQLDQDVDIKEIISCFTIDVIGSCAFGIECNSFKNPEAEFRRMGKRIFECDFFEPVRAFLMLNFPELAVSLRISSNKKDVQRFFIGSVAQTVKLRNENKITRNDFLQLLIEMLNKSELSIDEVSAQCFLFFVAGFESSSTAMTFALFELARHPEVQDKLRKEIEEVTGKYEGKITYEGITEMRYLSQVADEALRMYTPLATLNRSCTKDYTLRDTNIVIPKGTRVIISTLGLHTDPEYYPDPEKFDPERFSEENKATRHQFVHLPFGDGPRNCIGLRFGRMQSKVGIATVIKNFKLSVSPATKEIEFEEDVFLLSPINKIYLKAERI